MSYSTSPAKLRRFASVCNQLLAGCLLLVLVGVLFGWARSYWIGDHFEWRRTGKGLGELHSYGGHLSVHLLTWAHPEHSTMDYQYLRGISHDTGKPLRWEQPDPKFAWGGQVYHVSRLGFVVMEQNWPDRQWLKIEAPYWSVAAPVGLAFVVSGLGVVRRRSTTRRAKRGRCARCGYDLRASNERCPECGEPIPSATTANAREALPADPQANTFKPLSK